MNLSVPIGAGTTMRLCLGHSVHCSVILLLVPGTIIPTVFNGSLRKKEQMVIIRMFLAAFAPIQRRSDCLSFALVA